MKYHKQFSLKSIFFKYCLLGCIYLFFSDSIFLFFYNNDNSIEFLSQIQFYKEFIFFILSLLFFSFLIEKRNKITKVHISNIKKTQKQYLDLFNNTSHLFAILDEKGKYTYMSPTSEVIVGIPPEKFIGKDFFENIHPDDIIKARKDFNKILENEKVKMQLYRAKNIEGKWIWIETTLENMLNKPAIEGIIVNSRNITHEVEEKQHLKLLESVITNTKDAVLITEAEPFDLPGPKILYINEAFTKMTGYSPQEVIGKTPRILQGPKTNKEELAKLSKAIRNWESCEITIINYKKNGEEFWINFSVTPVPDENGWYTHWIAIERDVTESINSKEKLIRAKEKAEDNERKMKEAQKLAKLGSWYYDFKNQISQWSEETYNIWGLDSKNTIVNLIDHQKIIHPKDWIRFNEVINSAIEKGTTYKMELDLVMPDNSIKTVNTIGKPVFDSNNELIAYEGSTQDITELISKEKELKIAIALAEKNQYSINQASQLAKIGFWEYDFTTKKGKSSEYIYQLLGNDPDDKKPTYEEFLNRLDSQSKQKIADVTKEMLKSGKPYDIELRTFNNKNEEIWVRNMVEPIYNEANEIIGKRGVVQNITEEKYIKDLNTEIARLVKIGSWSVDLENGTVFWSEEIHQLHETDSKTYVPNLEEGINFYREDFRDMVRFNVENTIKTGVAFDFEAVIVTAKNNEIWIRSIGNADFVNGNCVRLYGGFQEITEKKLAALELEKSLKSLKDYKYSLDQSAIIAFTDQKGVITYTNDNFCKISGYSRDELIGNTHSMINANYHPESFFIDLWKTIASGKVWRGEIKNKAKDGSYYWVDTTIVPFLNEKNRPNQYLAIRFDITERKNTTEEKKRFHKTLENSVNEIYMFDAETLKFLYLNKGALQNLGYTEDEIVNLTPLDLKKEFTYESFNELIKPLINKEQEKIIFFTTHQRKDRSFYPVEVHLNLVEDENFKNFIAIILDITERKNAAEEKNRFLKTLENSVNEIYIFDSDTFKFSYVNKSALQNLGYTTNEIKEITPLDIKPDFTYESFHKLTNPLKNKEQEKIIFFTTHKRKDGSTYPVEIHLNLVEEENYKNFIAIVLDISERKKAEKMYQLLAENTNDIITLQDKYLNIKYISPAITNILGYDNNEFYIQNLEKIIHEDDLQQLMDNVFNKLLQGETIEPLTFRVYDNKGNIVWLESLFSTLIENGEITTLISTSRDVTQWMIAQKEIEDYQTSLQKLTKEISMIEEKQKKEIAANIHDHLSQSLVISRMRIVDLEKKPELKNIYNDLEFVKNHISNALENSRKITYELSPPVIYQLGIVDALDWFADETQEKYNINFNFTTNVERVELSEFKSILLFRCVQEAVTNTLKYAEASLITLDFNKGKEKITLTLVDNGKGFETEILNKNISSGSGFGLFAVKERIRNLNGELTITSKINVGTKIKISVPL